MELKQYIEDATTTESIIETVKVDPNLLAATFQILIASGNILDQIKKNAFYDKPYNINDMVVEFANIVTSLDKIKTVFDSGLDIQETAYNPRIFHSIVGITTEAVELIEGMSDENFDTVNFLEELGDLNWYEAIGIDAVNGDFNDVLTTNIAKLKARYPNKFDKDAAINRNLKTEREILDKLDIDLNDDGC